MINFDVYVEELAELIRHVDSKNELGAVTLAEKIVADGFLERVVRDFEDDRVAKRQC